MNLIKKHLNRDYNLFQQDPILNGLDEIQNDSFANEDDFLIKPARIGETIRCRLTSLNKIFSEYLFVIENNQGYQIPLMVGKSSKLSLSSIFLIQTYENYSLQNNIGIATVERGLFSSNFIVYDSLNSTSENIDTQNSKGLIRRQLLRIDYDAFLNNIGIPLKMKVYLPGIDEYLNRYSIDSFDNLTDSDADIYKSKDNSESSNTNKNFESKGYIEIEHSNMITLGLTKYGNKTANVSVFNKKIVKLVNNPPFYDKKTNIYKLQMSERVKLSSVVNFQLINELSSNYIVLQYGRLDKDSFTCDFSYPLNALQAFSIVLTRMHKMNLFNQ